MTKEEIIEQHPILVHIIGGHGIGAFQLIGKAMDEYAKQQTVAFTNWTLSGDCDTYSCTDENQWTNIFTNENITAEQLYNKFIEQQNK